MLRFVRVKTANAKIGVQTDDDSQKKFLPWLPGRGKYKLVILAETAYQTIDGR